MTSYLEQLEQKQLIWRGREAGCPLQARPSGWPEVDEQLGGWPDAGVTHIHSRPGVGELRLLWPSVQRSKGLSVFIAPPYSLSAEGLYGAGVALNQLLILHPETPNSQLWAAEQSLRSGACEVVCLWRSQPLQTVQARRLQLAAKAGKASLFLFSSGAETGALPLDLCLQLTPHSQGLMITVPRRRHGWALPAFLVSMENAWPELTAAAFFPSASLRPNQRAGRTAESS